MPKTSTDRDEALRLLLRHPARAARLCGFTRLTDELHGRWMRDMILGQEDMTLLAHRGSCKTTCLAFAMAVMVLIYPRRNILFMRKTDEDVIEVLRQVKMILRTDVMRRLALMLYGTPVSLVKTDMFTVQVSCYAAMRGAAQLFGQGTGGSLTGKHADILITDDIVNLHDRTSTAERQRIRGVYQELQNIRNPGGRIINTGTPWHPEDAISLMPNIRRCDCYHSGLLSDDEIRRLQGCMSPSLFAANYELRHIAAEDALFSVRPPMDADPSLLRDGIAHVDAAYGGGDLTALTCARRCGDRLILYGRLWSQPVDAVMDEIIAACETLLCGPLLLETNGDKGYVAREFRRRGMMVRPYQERMNKHIKIVTYLRKWWPKVAFVRGSDRAYVDQILEYTANSAHDDAPDSAASIIRLLDRQSS